MSLTLDIECLCLLAKLMHSLIVGTIPHTSNPTKLQREGTGGIKKKKNIMNY